jgi:hypothetical protein
MKILKISSVVIFAFFLSGCQEKKGDTIILEVPVPQPQMIYETEISVKPIFKGKQEISSLSLDILGQNNQNNFYAVEIWENFNNELCYLDSASVQNDRVFFTTLNFCNDTLSNEQRNYLVKLSSNIEIIWDVGNPVKFEEITYRSVNNNVLSDTFRDNYYMEDNTFFLTPPYSRWSSDEFILKDITFQVEPNTEYRIFNGSHNEDGSGSGGESFPIFSDENGILKRSIGMAILENNTNVIGVEDLDGNKVSVKIIECTVMYSTDELHCPYISEE